MKVLSIDIGATNIRSCMFEVTNTGGVHSVEALHEPEATATPKNKIVFLKCMETIIAAQPQDGIAICVPGTIDYHDGKILHLPNMHFMDGVDLKLFLKKFSKNIQIDNDAKCHLRAEYALGVAKKYKNVLLAAVGTGIGGAILVNGEIYYGQGSAGEIGHMIIDNGRSLEQLAAGRTAVLHRDKDFQRVGKFLGIGLANLVNILNPEAVILAGGFAHDQSSRFLAEAKKSMQKYVTDPRAKKTPVVIGQVGPNAALMGAALLF